MNRKLILKSPRLFPFGVYLAQFEDKFKIRTQMYLCVSVFVWVTGGVILLSHTAMSMMRSRTQKHARHNRFTLPPCR